MNTSTSITVLQAAVALSDLEIGMKYIDQIKEWNEMEGAIALLRGQERKFASASYLLGHLWVRQAKWSDAYDCFLGAADGGINSAYYRAAQILRDHGAHLEKAPESTPLELFSLAAKNGHIWSQQILLRARSKSSKLAKLVWWINRLALWPLSLLSAAIFKSQRDKLRY